MEALEIGAAEGRFCLFLLFFICSYHKDPTSRVTPEEVVQQDSEQINRASNGERRGKSLLVTTWKEREFLGPPNHLAEAGVVPGTIYEYGLLIGLGLPVQGKKKITIFFF